jgi:exopolysaccharide biosynthesis protein
MQITNRIFLIASTLLLAGCAGLGGSTAGSNDGWTSTHPAVSYRSYSPIADSVVHVARINLRDPSIRLALSESSQRGRTIDQYPQHQDALVAVNASFFSKTFVPRGLTASEGKAWDDATPAADWPLLACDRANHCEIRTVAPATSDTRWHTAVSGIPALLDAGQDVSAALCAPRLKFCNDPHPRTAVGLDAARNTLWIVAAEGRHPPVLGLSIGQLIDVLSQLGASDAVNLDGGGSSTFSIRGKQLMQRPDNEQELRVIGNALFVLQD